MVRRRFLSGAAEQFDYYAIESFIFKRFAGLEILKHRRFEVSEALGKIKRFIEQSGIEINGLRFCCRSDLRHAIQRQFCQRIGFHDFLHRGMGQATDGAKRSVPQELAPLDILNCPTNLTGNLRRSENPHNCLGRFMDSAVQLAQHDFASRRVFDRSRPEQLGTDIDHAGQGSLIAPSLCDLVGVVDAILQRQDNRAVADQGGQVCGGWVGVVGFEAQDRRRRLGWDRR